MIEAGVVIGPNDSVIMWHQPPGSSVVYLPDDRDLWTVFWDNRADLVGFAHSHSGRGVPHPSYEDLTTFSAVERALGRPVAWWILSEDRAVLVSFLSTIA